jgi:hypothetical protein
MQEEPAALFLRVLVIDESPRVVGTHFVSATPAWISISKGCYDLTFCTHIEGMQLPGWNRLENHKERGKASVNGGLGHRCTGIIRPFCLY